MYIYMYFTVHEHPRGKVRKVRVNTQSNADTTEVCDLTRNYANNDCMRIQVKKMLTTQLLVVIFALLRVVCANSSWIFSQNCE